MDPVKTFYLCFYACLVNNAHTYTEIDDILDLPQELAATIIPQRVGCNPEDSMPQREAIEDEVRQLLTNGLLDDEEPTTEEPTTESPLP